MRIHGSVSLFVRGVAWLDSVSGAATLTLFARESSPGTAMDAGHSSASTRRTVVIRMRVRGCARNINLPSIWGDFVRRFCIHASVATELEYQFHVGNPARYFSKSIV